MVIAKIKLNPGNVGWFDELNHIHLTFANPTKEITSDMVLTNIKRGIAYGTICLVEGSLEAKSVIDTIEAKAIEETEINPEKIEQEVVIEEVKEVEEPKKSKAKSKTKKE